MQGYQQTYKLQLTKTPNKLVMKTDIPMVFLIHLHTHTHTEIRKHVQKGLYMRIKRHCMDNCLSETLHYTISN